MSESPEYRQPTSNRWERALWIVGAALVLVATLFEIFATIYLDDSLTSSDNASSGRTELEIAVSLAPSVLIVGLLSLVIAIAIRALRPYLLQRSTLAPGGDDAMTAQQPVTSDQPLAPAVTAPAPTDHSLYMRPTDEATAPRP